ncbi:lysyl oxidase family protein [Lentzea sp. NPDC051838]|uniref:lysyl oxidase family protein n=1 Tax=Lentzea sp. NPDC051838 TaxID=3154849 RepID=UPI003421343F
MVFKRPIAVIIAAVTASALTASSHAATQLLPDLKQAPVGCSGGYDGDPSRCDAWDVCMVTDTSNPGGDCVDEGDIRAVRLRFTTSVDNVGDGPFLVHAHRDSTRQDRMAVRQAIQSEVDGPIPMTFGEAQHPTPTWSYYEPAAAHEHWHLMGFEYFQLRTPAGDTVVTDRKNGFCLGDRYTSAHASALPNRPKSDSPAGALARELNGHKCQHHNPEALDVFFGISVGKGDDYKYHVEFQWLDITRVASGTYDVVTVANPDRVLLEKNYDNNASSMAISVQWPNGASRAPARITKPPVVKLLRGCPGKIRCAEGLGHRRIG